MVSWAAKPKYEDGDVRVKTFFALFPRKCDNGRWHWLEHIDKKEKYVKELIGESYWKTVSTLPVTWRTVGPIVEGART